MKNFAVTGVAGFVAPRHLRAIYDTGNRVVTAVDPNDSVGMLDSFGYDIRFFREIERFDRHLDKRRRSGPDERVHYVSICSPNYLHDAHARIALRNEADVICEKPLVVNPWNLDALEQLEVETGHRVYTVLQLRLHPDLVTLRERLMAAPGRRHQVQLSYVTSRGAWYDMSWKGIEAHSGGVSANVGIHFFDLLIWLFGGVRDSRVHHRDARCFSGALDLERADVQWFLSVDRHDLPFAAVPGKSATFRSITVDGADVEFSDGFTDLHRRVYEACLGGEGFGIPDARPSIELVHRIRHDHLQPSTDVHPFLVARRAR